MLLTQRNYRNAEFCAADGSTAHRLGQAGPAPWRPNSSGSETAPIVVRSHTTSVGATQDAMPRTVSPCVTAVARINAKTVNARPVPPRSSDAYPWGNFKINKDSVACATANTTTATMNPDTDNETPGITHAATSSPIAHDPRSRTARNRICLMALSVGLGTVLMKDRSQSPCRHSAESAAAVQAVADVLQIVVNALQITFDGLQVGQRLLVCLLHLVRGCRFELRAVGDDGSGDEIGALTSIPDRRLLHGGRRVGDVGVPPKEIAHRVPLGGDVVVAGNRHALALQRVDQRLLGDVGWRNRLSRRNEWRRRLSRRAGLRIGRRSCRRLRRGVAVVKREHHGDGRGDHDQGKRDRGT